MMSREGPGAELSFGFRGEGITWRLGPRVIEVGFSYGDGPRVFTEGMAHWADGSALTPSEMECVFQDVLHFVKSAWPKATVVINADDPHAPEWERLCVVHRRIIAGVEHTSDEQQFQFERSMYLRFLQGGRGITIDDTVIRTEQELDDYLRPRRKVRAR